MTTPTTRPAKQPRPGRESPARDRVLETAAALFYGEGIRAVGVDRIIAEAGVAKATFYHHFPTKDELVRAYLEAELARQQAATARLPQGDPLDAVLTIFEVVGEIGCGPDFRGCPFVNAATEYPDESHPVRQVVRVHRSWFRATLSELLVEAGHADPDRTAGMLILVRDGIVVGGSLDDARAVRALIRDTAIRVLNHPGRPA